MSVHPLRAVDPVTQAKIHLAAAHRLAVLDELEEGIDNHFTVTVPGRNGQYLILPFGLHWSEARASDMIVFDESGKSLQVLSDAIVAQVRAPPGNDRHSRTERERLFFEAMMRILDSELPGYAD